METITNEQMLEIEGGDEVDWATLIGALILAVL